MWRSSARYRFCGRQGVLVSDPQIAAVKVAPPVLVSIMQEATAGLPTFILWATAIYTVLQIALVARKIIKREN